MAEPTPAPLGTMIFDHADLFREAAGMERRAATEGDHHARCNVLAALDGMDTRSVGHVLFDDLGHACSGPEILQAELVADMLERKRLVAASLSSLTLPPAKNSGSILPEHNIGICDRGHRCRRAHRTPGPGVEPALSGPTVRRPSLSTRAIEPPPAPISTISITGMRTGMPEPFMSL